MKRTGLVAAASAFLIVGAPAMAADGPNDPQIAHIAYTAGSLDAEIGKLALQKSSNAAVREFAQTMVRDHEAVNGQALALVKKLGVTPQANATSEMLTKQAAETRARLSALSGATFDRAYVANEVAYHATVNSALQGTLIPSADNGELKALLVTGLSLFRAHQAHAEQLAKKL